MVICCRQRYMHFIGHEAEAARKNLTSGTFSSRREDSYKTSGALPPFHSPHLGRHTRAKRIHVPKGVVALRCNHRPNVVRIRVVGRLQPPRAPLSCQPRPFLHIPCPPPPPICMPPYLSHLVQNLIRNRILPVHQSTQYANSNHVGGKQRGSVRRWRCHSAARAGGRRERPGHGRHRHGSLHGESGRNRTALLEG